jgi:hypothetical protein
MRRRNQGVPAHCGNDGKRWHDEQQMSKAVIERRLPRDDVRDWKQDRSDDAEQTRERRTACWTWAGLAGVAAALSHLAKAAALPLVVLASVAWGNAIKGTGAHGDRDGWPRLPSEQLPGPAKYWREHSLADIGARIGAGYRQMAIDLWAGFWALKFAAATLLAGAYVLWPHRARIPALLGAHATLASLSRSTSSSI